MKAQFKPEEKTYPFLKFLGWAILWVIFFGMSLLAIGWIAVDAQKNNW